MQAVTHRGRWKGAAKKAVVLLILVAGGYLGFQWFRSGWQSGSADRLPGASDATQRSYEKWLDVVEQTEKKQTAQSGTIYRWQDDHGNWHTSSKPRQAPVGERPVVESKPVPAPAPDKERTLEDLPGIRQLREFVAEKDPVQPPAPPAMDREELKAKMQEAREFSDQQKKLLEEEAAP